jgi:CTD kinase subunit beta
MFPPHTIALGSIYLAALLTSFEIPSEASKFLKVNSTEPRTSHQLAKLLGEEGDWETQFGTRAEDVDGTPSFIMELISKN